MQRIAVFDFDGTLTRRDTLLDFIRFARGWRLFILCFSLFAPMIVLMKLRLLSNAAVKEKVLSFCFKGMDYEEFKTLGRKFVDEISKYERKETISMLNDHLSEGDKIYVVTASIEEWVSPWCQQHGVYNVIGTQMEVSSDGKLTGKLSSPNCYGAEKVRRFTEKEPSRDTFLLYAYGDSRGDKEMIEYADYGQYINKNYE